MSFDFGLLMKEEVLGLSLLHCVGKRNAELNHYYGQKTKLHAVFEDKMVGYILKMETCFVRCFGGEIGLFDDADFAAIVLKQNFRENKEKTKCEGD